MCIENYCIKKSKSLLNLYTFDNVILSGENKIPSSCFSCSCLRWHENFTFILFVLEYLYLENIDISILKRFANVNGRIPEHGGYLSNAYYFIFYKETS